MSDGLTHRTREAIGEVDRGRWSEAVEKSICTLGTARSRGALMNEAEPLASTIVLGAVLRAGLTGVRVHLIVFAESDVQSWCDRLAEPARKLGLTMSGISAAQSVHQRQLAWQSALIVCPAQQLLQDRAYDLGRWPLPGTATHRQFDRLYGRRSSQGNRLVAEAELALIPEAERLLIDSLATKANLTSEADTGAGGVLHLYDLLASYPRISGAGRFSRTEQRELVRYYGVKVLGGPYVTTSMVVVRDRRAQLEELLGRIETARQQGVGTDVCSDDQTLLDELRATVTTECGGAIDLRLYQGLSELERALQNAERRRKVLIVRGRGPSSVRLSRNRSDSRGFHDWVSVYSLDEELFLEQISAPGVWLAQLGFASGLSVWVSRVVIRLAHRSERRQRRAFVDHIDIMRRRFAFARVGYPNRD